MAKRSIRGSVRFVIYRYIIHLTGKAKPQGKTLFIWHIETRKRGKNSEKNPAITAIYCCDIRIVTFKDYIMACDYD